MSEIISLFDFEETPEYKELPADDQRLATSLYVEKYGNDQAVSYLSDFTQTEDFQSLPEQSKSEFLNIYKDRYGIESEPDNALTQGFTNLRSATSYATGMGMRDFDAAAQSIYDITAYNDANPSSEAGQGLSKAWEGGEGVGGAIGDVIDEVLNDFNEAPGIWEGIASLYENAKAMGAGVVKQTPNMIPPMTGLLTGGAIGSTMGPVSAALGGFAGASAGNAMVEGQGIAISELQKAGINPKDKDAVRDFLEKNYTDLFGKTAGKGAIIGAVDTATMGISHFLLSGPGKIATKKALTSMGVDIADKAAVKAATKSTEFGQKILADKAYQATQRGINKAARNTVAATMEPAGEFTGEYLGSGVALDDWDTKNATLEALSSVGQSGITFAGQKAIQTISNPRKSIEEIIEEVDNIDLDDPESAAEALGGIEDAEPVSHTIDNRIQEEIEKAYSGLQDAITMPPLETGGPQAIPRHLNKSGQVGPQPVFEPQIDKGQQTIRQQWDALKQKAVAYQAKIDDYAQADRARSEAIKNGTIPPDQLTDQEYALFLEEKMLREEHEALTAQYQEQFSRSPEPVGADFDPRQIDDEETPEAFKSPASKQSVEVASENVARKQMAEIRGRGGINKASAEQMFSTDTINSLNRKYPGLFTKKGTDNVDEIAEEFGYSGADEMVSEWEYTGTKKDEIARAQAEEQAEWDRAEDASKEAEREASQSQEVNNEENVRQSESVDSGNANVNQGGGGNEEAGVGDGEAGTVERIDNADSVAHGQEVNTNPSEKQKEAENYKMAHVRHDGLDFSIENPAGSTRSGTDGTGKKWSIEMKNDYGRIKGTEGYDKDHVDVFFAKGYQGGADKVHIVNQYNDDGTFDEVKVVIGAKNPVDAKRTYNANYEKGWTGGKDVVEMSMDEFKEWVKSDAPKSGPAKPASKVEDGRPKNKARYLLDTVMSISAARKKIEGDLENKNISDKSKAKKQGLLAEIKQAEAIAREEMQAESEKTMDRFNAERDPRKYDGKEPHEMPTFVYLKKQKGKPLKVAPKDGILSTEPEHMTAAHLLEYYDGKEIRKLARALAVPHSGKIATVAQKIEAKYAFVKNWSTKDQTAESVLENLAGKKKNELMDTLQSAGFKRMAYLDKKTLAKTIVGKADSTRATLKRKIRERNQLYSAHRAINRGEKVNEKFLENNTEARYYIDEFAAKGKGPVNDKQLSLFDVVGGELEQTKKDTAETPEVSEKEASQGKPVPQHVLGDYEGLKVYHYTPKDNWENNLMKAREYAAALDLGGKVDWMDKKAIVTKIKETLAEQNKEEGATKTTYGKDNKIISQNRADEVLAKLKAKLNNLNSGVDPEIIALGTELAVFHIEAGARKFADFSKTMVKDLGEKIKPFLRSFYEGARYYPGLDNEGMSSAEEIESLGQDNAESDTIKEKGEVDSATGSANSLEPDSRNGQSEGSGLEKPIRNEAGEDRPGLRGSLEGNGETGNRQGGSVGVLEPSTATDGKGGSAGNSATKPGASKSTSRTTDSGRNAESSNTGLQPDRKTSQSAEEVAGDRSKSLEDRLKAQRNAEDIPVLEADLSNIRETVPVLFDEQQEDVYFAEQRLFNKSKKPERGVMLTNGTGTGKTFSGLGLVKRFAKQGKDNVLIVVPGENVAAAWMQAGKSLDLSISQLEGIKDAGSGINVTSYANFRHNDEIVNRDFDLIVMDESHKLLENQAGNATSALRKFWALTGHEKGRYTYADAKEHELVEEISELKAAIEQNESSDDSRYWDKAVRQKDKLDGLLKKLAKKQKVHMQDREVHWINQKTKVLFLSATPFAYDFSLDYGEGFLFHFGGTANQGYGYNETDARESFYTSNLGYRMRYNRLTQPEADVDRGLMQRELNERLKKEGAIRGRRLTVDHDYSREFIAASDLIGNKIDEAFDYLWDQSSSDEHDEDMKKGYTDLLKRIRDNFKYHEKIRILEAIKAKHAIPRIKKHMALGRKIVLFHSRIQGGGRNIFALDGLPDLEQKAYDHFKSTRPHLANMDLSNLTDPLTLLKREFGDRVTYYNGTINKRAKTENPQKFNADDSGVDIIMVQDEGGKEGISLHDTTGKYQRVLMNLGLPVRPTQAIQIEGRTYRVGQKSDAIFEYFNTGTNFEQWTFGSTISERASTAENLALGNEARALKDAFVDAFEDTNDLEPSLEQGTGGKASDSSTLHQASEFDKAKTHYFANQKKTSRNKAKEGKDYFATPEPLGLKMVEWADIKPGDKVLEPSAGHGAIGRYFPEYTNNTFIEPSSALSSKLTLRAAGDVKQQQFEDLHITNKFDAIVMNPPFGAGGSTAIKHVAKAAQHLRDGGRIVAIIPEGPAANKKFDKWYDSKQAKDIYLQSSLSLPAVTFKRAGTSVRVRVIILDKYTKKENASAAVGRGTGEVSADTTKEFFDKIENRSYPGRQEVSKSNNDILESKGLAVEKHDDEEFPWKVTGKTFPFKKTLKGIVDTENRKWDRDAGAWIYSEDPTEKLVEALTSSDDSVKLSRATLSLPKSEQANISQELEQKLGRVRFRRLINKGLLEIVSQSRADEIISMATGKQSVPENKQAEGRIEGFQTGSKAYLVEGNIRSGQAYAVLLHEVGVHLYLEKKLQGKQWEKIVAMFDNHAKQNTATGRAVREARERVPADTKGADRDAEGIAYYLSNSANREQSLYRKIVAYIKKKLVDLGFPASILTPEDVVVIAKSALKRIYSPVQSKTPDVQSEYGGSRYENEQKVVGIGENEFHPKAKEAYSIGRDAEGIQSKSLSGQDRADKIQELEEAGFYDAQKRSDKRDMLRRPGRTFSFSDGRSSTAKDRVASYNKWKGGSLAEINGEPMLFYHGSPTFGTEDSTANWTFDESLRGSNIKHPLAQLGTTFTANKYQAEEFFSRKTKNVNEFFVRVENPYILKPKDIKKLEKILHRSGTEGVRSWVKQKMELGNHDSFFDPGKEFLYLTDSNQAKHTANSGEFGKTGDVRRSVSKSQTRFVKLYQDGDIPGAAKNLVRSVDREGINKKLDDLFGATDPNDPEKPIDGNYTPMFDIAADYQADIEHAANNRDAQEVEDLLNAVREEEREYDTDNGETGNGDVQPEPEVQAPWREANGPRQRQLFKDKEHRQKPAQLKLFENSPEYANDVKFSVSNPFTGTKDTIDRVIENSAPKWRDRWERFVYHMADTNDPRKRVMDRAGAQTARTDILTVERLRGKKTADETDQFMKKQVEPLLKQLAKGNVGIREFEEYKYALHVPERNEQMRRVNAKRYIDRLLQQMTPKEANFWKGAIDDIRTQADIEDWALSEKHDAYLSLMDEIFADIDRREQDLDDKQRELDEREWTDKEVEKGTDTFLYGRLKKARERIRHSREINSEWDNASVRFAGITDEEADTILRKFDGDSRISTIKSASKKLDQINSQKLKVLYDSGELSKEEYFFTKNLYKHYVPLYRDGFDDQRPATGRPTGPTGKPLQVAKGSMREVVDIFAHTVQNYQTAINRSHKAEAGRTLFNFVQHNPDSGITIEAGEKKPTHDKEGNLVIYTDTTEPDNGVFVKVDGQRYTLVFDTDTRTEKGRTLGRFLESIKNTDVGLGSTMRFLTAVNRKLAMINTMLSPEFILSNFTRDAQTAGIHLEETKAKGLQKKVIKDLFPAIHGIFQAEYGKESTKMAKWYRDFAKNGGKIGWLQGYDNIADLAGELEATMKLYQDGHTTRKSIKALKDLISNSNTAVENGVRLAVYKNLVEAGESKAKAALAASNLTVDFTRRGKLGPKLNALYMFANAGIQGNVRMIKAVSRSSKVRKIVGGITATGFAMHLLALSMGGDDDTGEPYINGVEDFIKERNMIIMLPGTKGKYIKIPMPYGYNGFFNLGTEVANMVATMARGKDYDATEGAMRIASTFAGSFNPIQGGTILQTLSPTITDPIVQASENKSWSGGDLMPEQSPYGPQKPDSTRYWSTVSKPSKYITAALNKLTGGDEYKSGLIDISPETLDMLYDTATGSLGRFVTNTFMLPGRILDEKDVPINKIPFVRRFAGEQSEYVTSRRYREQLEDIEIFKQRFENAKTVAERRKLAKDPLYLKMKSIKSFEKAIKKLRKKRNKYRGAGRQRDVDLLDEKIRELQSSFLKKTYATTKNK